MIHRKKMWLLDWSYVSKKWATFCALSCCCQTANPETNSPSLSHQGYKIASFPGGSDNSLPTMREAWVQSLGREDLLEKEMATCSSILAWKIPWMEDPGRLQAMGSQRVRHHWATSLHFCFLCACSLIEQPSLLSSPLRNRNFIPSTNFTLNRDRTGTQTQVHIFFLGQLPD